MFRGIKDLGLEWKLAKEFEEYKTQHKCSVLLARMITYYETIMANEILLPFDTPEKRAQDSIRELYNRDKNEFNRLYEKAWEEIAEMMD